MKKPELLAPAGNLDILKIAFLYGADAVYCGTPDFAMRSRVGFDLATLKEGIDYTHSIGKKIYVTINAFPHSDQIAKLRRHIPKIIAQGPDALIIADPGVLAFAHERYPKMPIHLSTQANTTNYLAASFWKKQGVKRIVLARELNLTNIKMIKSKAKVSLECFVHGAMCMAYSGRCQISNYMVGRDPNQGQCIQACRFKYKMYALEEEYRPGQVYPILEDESGSYILNSKDLCMIEHIPDLINAGIGSFKIEGRLKTEYYVATIIRAYRDAIDLFFLDPKLYKKSRTALKKELSKASNRGFTTGFFLEKPTKDSNNYQSSKATSEWGYIGRVIGYDDKRKRLKFEVKNYLPVNSKIEIITPRRSDDPIVKNPSTVIKKLYRDDLQIETAHAGNIVEIPFTRFVPKDSFVRVKLI